MDCRIGAHINKICMVTVKAIGAVLMAYLFLLSIFSTGVRSVYNYGTVEKPEWGRYTYFLPDSPVKHIMIIFLLILILAVVQLAVSRVKARPEVGFWGRISTEVICGVYFLVVLLYILNTQFLPKSDPAELLKIADEILNQDFHEFEREGYMYRYPYQSGFVFVCMAAIELSGSQAYLILQILNAASVTVFFYLLGKLAELWWGYNKRQVSYFILLSMSGSVPLLIYVTFIYGNLPGMALATAAIYFLQAFLKERKISRLSEAAFCISMAIALKSNCLIPLVAMLIVLAWDGIQGRRIREALGAVLCVLACCFLVNQGVVWGMEAITGYELSEGMPKTALIAMGLEESAAGPGTENGSSNRIYEESGYRYKEADKIAKGEIKSRLKEFAQNPTSLISFFARKQALQCNEPTFQCFSISANRDSNIKVPGWLNNMVAGRGSLYLTEMMNMIHAIILFGTCCYVFSINVKKPRLDELIFLIIFIGSFLFQMFYEAKSQYMLIFFFMLLPYTVQGYRILLKILKGLEQKERRMAAGYYIKGNRIRIGIAVGALCLMIIAGVRTGLFAHTICLKSSPEQIKEYLEVVKTRENPNG